MIVVLDEAPDRPLELPRAMVHVELHDVLHRSVIPLDLPLGHRVIRRAPRVREPVLREVRSEGFGDVARPVVAEEPRTVDDVDLVDPGFRADHLIAVQFTIDAERHSTPAGAAAAPAGAAPFTLYYSQVIEKVRTLPGEIGRAHV